MTSQSIMRPVVPFYLLGDLSLPFLLCIILFCLQAAGSGVDSRGHGDHRNITGGGTVTSTAIVPFASPGIHESRGKGYFWATPSSEPEAFLQGLLAKRHAPPGSWLPASTGDVVMPHIISRRRRTRTRPSRNSTNCSSAVLRRLHEFSYNEVPSGSLDYPSNVSLPGLKVGMDLWPGALWWEWNQSQVIISSKPAVVKVIFGHIYWFNALFSIVTTTRKDGVVQRLVWYTNTSARNNSLGECAAFGLLSSAAGATSICICLKASRLHSPKDWGLPVRSRLNASLECGEQSAADSIFVVWGHHSASVEASVHVERCRQRCITNSTCTAFAAVEAGADSRCITWMLQDYTRREKYKSNSSLHFQSYHGLFLLSLLILLLVIILSFAPAAYVLLKNKMENWRPGIPCPGCTSAHRGVHVPLDRIVGDLAFNMDLSTVKTATGDFSKRNIIGEGGFAFVYKGKLSKNHVLSRGLHKRKIAVKRLKRSALSIEGSDEYFAREVDLMSRLKHANLVRLLAYCVEDDERILVYERMQHKSLDGYILGTRKLRASLNWAKRLEIILGVAHGVCYLHEGSGQNIIHRDLKPSNVLLDHDWIPKVADFGTTKLFVTDDTKTQTIVFSPGYAAPEYIRGDVTLKCDVYSFGVIVLEIISGRKNSAMPNLISYAWKLWDKHTIMDLLDSSLVFPRCQPELWSRIRRCIQIGLLCVQESPNERPNMSEVLAMLASDSEPRKPQAPAVFAVTAEQLLSAQ